LYLLGRSDKIAASKKKGLWVGGVVPLGYELRDRNLIVNEEDAAMAIQKKTACVAMRPMAPC
jgi:hypothetical protein